jgi:isocitrate dehydrogenase
MALRLVATRVSGQVGRRALQSSSKWANSTSNRIAASSSSSASSTNTIIINNTNNHHYQNRFYSSTTPVAEPDPEKTKLSLLTEPCKAPPMVYIKGEEMTHYACTLIVDQWITPYFDTSAWETYDLSCKARDASKDQVLKDSVEAGARIGAIFKEPTITPSAIQVKEMGLSKAWGSPNGAMRKGWNGITISRDTIHIEGMELGYKKPVFFERHAVGGEYGAGWNAVGQGTLLTTYLPKDGAPIVVDKRDLTDDNNVVVVYHNPYDNVAELAHLFFKRCFAANITPYVVTKKTVFKWQEGFWATMKEIFDKEYKDDFVKVR